jgi:Baseplate J-like protein
LQWQGAPSDFKAWYSGYTKGGSLKNSSFTAKGSFQDGGGKKHSGTVQLFDSPNDGERTLTIPASAFVPSSERTGFLVLSLERDFLHADYRKESVENVVKYSKGDVKTLVVLNEPYTPTLQAISLSYTAQSGTPDSDVQLFHVGPFGSRRVTGPRVPLLPEYEHEGELLLGLSGLAAGDSVSLLFQVAEGSANPDLRRQDVAWSVLCDNHWKPFSRSEIVRDTTNQLLRSGVVGLVIPPEATRENTFLPAGWLWLRAAVSRDVEAVSQLIAVAANAVEVRFQDHGNDPSHLLAPFPAGSLSRLKTPVAAVKTVKQPFASFGGSPVESAEALHTRAAERLRHRNRCITAWDYERMVLSTFPGVHKAKCIPHAKDGAWLAPGNVLVVVVPDLRNRNAVDPLQPRVDADTLDRITEHLQGHAGAQVRVRVKNPLYQQIRLDFKARFLPGYEFNFYRAQVEQELIRFLSPWAFDVTRPISFGGKVYKSVLLDFVEELAPVDFVTDFRMYSSADPLRDVNEIQAATPDTILVSASVHTIAEAV